MKISRESNNKSERRRRVAVLWACIAIGMVPAASRATDSSGPRPSSHAPIGVMGDHTHHAGEWMVSYRYMRMRMAGLRDNDDGLGANRVLEQFPVTPLRMDMEMHMVGVMYAPIEQVTLALMLPYVRLEMDHRTRTGREFTTRTDGLGDIRASALIKLLSRKNHQVHAQLGISFPTGSITEQDRTPASGNATVRIPYPMQIGSGSYDFLPGLTYAGHTGIYAWGAQGRGEVRLNENHANYRLGNEYALTAWGSVDLLESMSASLRLEWGQVLNIRGRDESPRINPIMIPTADSGRRAAARLDLLAGVNFAAPKGFLEGFRIAIEAGLPVYQRLDGPGLETDWLLTTGVQYAF